MLSGKGNRNGEKTTVGLISKKATFHVRHTFFLHFFVVVLLDYTVKLPETSWLHVLWRKCRTSGSLYFDCRSFSLWWPLAFLIFSTPLKNFLPTKIVSFYFFVSRCSSLSLVFSLGFAGLRLISLHTFSFSFSFSIFQTCGPDN